MGTVWQRCTYVTESPSFNLVGVKPVTCEPHTVIYVLICSTSSWIYYQGKLFMEMVRYSLEWLLKWRSAGYVLFKLVFTCTTLIRHIYDTKLMIQYDLSFNFLFVLVGFYWGVWVFGGFFCLFVCLFGWLVGFFFFFLGGGGFFPMHFCLKGKKLDCLNHVDLVLSIQWHTSVPKTQPGTMHRNSSVSLPGPN